MISHRTLLRSVALNVLFPSALLVPAMLTAQRLPQSVQPEHYTLALTPDLQTATFKGHETIDVHLDAPSTTITLNSIEIGFKNVSVTTGGKTMAAAITLDEAKQQATFSFPDAVPAGKAQLAIEYTGILNNELRGFYLSKTAKRNYAVTQFEATDARRAFPCFDEPAFKATYDVALTIDAADSAIANGALVSDTPGPIAGKHTLKFDRTPKLSTYLLAFLVGDFECKTGEQDGVTIRVCATPEKLALTQYGLDFAKFTLHYYNQYFGIPFPLKKLDLIGIPDFEAGAMENFGAITYRETALLVDEKTGSESAKKEVALVIAHEMAHQWFGDLVTMKWWDNLWLNEGFATWMEAKPLAASHPEWNIDQDVADGGNHTLDVDALPTTRSIRAKADTPDEINQMFDGIAYGKAGAVLLMVENYLGAETFRQGVHNYLAAHLYSNATAEDFWGAQTATSHKPVDKIMESLVVQTGEPLLTFGEEANGAIPVSQKRLFSSPSQKVDPAEQWTLPVCFKTPGGQHCEVITPSTKSIALPAAPFVFANAFGKGYYRSAYPAAAYKQIVDAAATQLSPVERISLASDEWAQVRSGKATVGNYLDLMSALSKDENTAVVSSVTGPYGSIRNQVASNTEERDALAEWWNRLATAAYSKLPAATATDTSNQRELRAELFSKMDKRVDSPVLADARLIAEKFLADPTSVDPNMGHAALAIAARHGDATMFDRLQKIFETSTNPEMQESALRLLVQFDDAALQKRALEYALSGKVRNQDSAIVFAIALQNSSSREAAWSFLKENWLKVQAQLTTEMGGRLVGSTGGFCTADAREDVKNFFATHPVPSSGRSLKSSLERMDGCMELRKLQEANLQQWLAEHKQ